MSERTAEHERERPRRRGRQGAKRISWDLEGIRSLVCGLLDTLTPNDAAEQFRKKVRKEAALFDAVCEYAFANARAAYDREQPPKTKPEYQHPPPASPSQVSAMLTRVDTWRRSLLRVYTIDGVPLGDCTGDVVRERAQQHGFDARFLTMIAEGVPDGSKIAEHVSEKDATRLYELARKRKQ